MAGSQLYLIFWVVLAVAATGRASFYQRLSPEEIQEKSETGRKDPNQNLQGVKADDVPESLDTLQQIGQAEEYEVGKFTALDKEDDVHGSSLYMSSSNETVRHRRSTGTTGDKFYEYAQWWSGTSKAKYAVCTNPPEKSKVKKLHIYDCCYSQKGLEIQQTVGTQEWDDVVNRNTNERTLFNFEHDNHGTTEDEFNISRKKTIQETNSWTVSGGVTTKFGMSVPFSFPDFFGLGVEYNFGVDISINGEKTTTKFTEETITVDQRFKVPPGKRVEIDWVISEETVTMNWHVDVFLKGAIGVNWDPASFLFINRNPPICGSYNYAIRVYKLADGINWHQHGADLRFRREGVFKGSRAMISKLVRRECDVNRPQDCTRARTSKVVYTSKIPGNVRILPVNQTSV